MVHACHSKLSVFSFPLVISYFSFLLFYFLFFQCLLLVIVFPRNSYYCNFRILFSVHSKGSFIEPTVTGIYCFSLKPLTAFVWCGCPYRPLTGHQWFSHHHLPVLAVPLPSARQRRLFCLLACYGFSTHYSVCVCVLSLYPSWHAPSGSISSLLLLGGMSSQQDISPKRV